MKIDVIIPVYRPTEKLHKVIVQALQTDAPSGANHSVTHQGWDKAGCFGL